MRLLRAFVAHEAKIQFRSGRFRLMAVVYTIARPDTAGDYGAETGYAPRETTSTAAELARLNELRTDGAISDAEFEDLKTRTIAAS